MRLVYTIVWFIVNVKALGSRHFASKWSPGIKVLCFFGCNLKMTVFTRFIWISCKSLYFSLKPGMNNIKNKIDCKLAE